MRANRGCLRSSSSGYTIMTRLLRCMLYRGRVSLWLRAITHVQLVGPHSVSHEARPAEAKSAVVTDFCAEGSRCGLKR